MRLLLDACALLAMKEPNETKPLWLVEIYRRRRRDLSVSALTIWEIEMKAARGPDFLAAFWEPDHASLHEQLTATGLALVPFTAEIATTAARLPLHHKDPFDRGLVATSLHLALPIVSFDRLVGQYEGVEVCWNRPPGA